MNAKVAQHHQELEALCQRHGVRRLELFGSAAATSDSAHGDLDFLVEFEESPPGGYADAYFGLVEGLEEVFRCPIDLVPISALGNPYFRESVEESKVLLYAA